MIFLHSNVSSSRFNAWIWPFTPLLYYVLVLTYSHISLAPSTCFCCPYLGPLLQNRSYGQMGKRVPFFRVSKLKVSAWFWMPFLVFSCICTYLVAEQRFWVSFLSILHIFRDFYVYGIWCGCVLEEPVSLHSVQLNFSFSNDFMYSYTMHFSILIGF